MLDFHPFLLVAVTSVPERASFFPLLLLLLNGIPSPRRMLLLVHLDQSLHYYLAQSLHSLHCPLLGASTSSASMAFCSSSATSASSSSFLIAGISSNSSLSLKSGSPTASSAAELSHYTSKTGDRMSGDRLGDKLSAFLMLEEHSFS
jgi:hypothetical protein